IGPTKFALFVAVAWALILAPGSDMLYVITRGIAYGHRAGIVSAIGVICAILVHTTAAAFGLTLILQTSAFAFRLVKYVGAVYFLLCVGKRSRSTAASAGLIPIRVLAYNSQMWKVHHGPYSLDIRSYVLQAIDQLLNHLLECGSCPVVKIVLAQVVPQVFDRIEFWTVGRLQNEPHILWNDQLIRVMPACPVNLHHDEIVRKFP